MGNHFAEGALEECFGNFDHFVDDFDLLLDEEYIRVTSLSTCEWLKSKTSLAEYFKWIGKDIMLIPGGFWASVETTFGIKRHSLRKLAGQNANPLKHGPSKDFIKIKPILEKQHKIKEYEHYQHRAYRHINNLILLLEDEKPDTIRELLEKIHKITTIFVDKNIQDNRKYLIKKT
jgi:hypothetical protein